MRFSGVIRGPWYTSKIEKIILKIKMQKFYFHFFVNSGSVDVEFDIFLVVEARGPRKSQ